MREIVPVLRDIRISGVVIDVSHRVRIPLSRNVCVNSPTDGNSSHPPWVPEAEIKISEN
jgi:hypothetical protein